MLDKARTRKTSHGLKQVELFEMDAEQMTFQDNTFDKVVAMYVASVVPHPKRLVEEMQRVCKPGGELFIVNHFHSTNPILARLEKLVTPFSKMVGFRPDLSRQAFIDETGLQVVETQRVNFLGYWTLLRATNAKRPALGTLEEMTPIEMATSH
jgi:phosphatidylethanolamine/phosphatidyl-N-methylethanolamine N-methyltransferase